MFDSHVAPAGELAHNQDMDPDWEWNQQPFGLQPALNPLSYTSQGRMSLYEFGSHLNLASV